MLKNCSNCGGKLYFSPKDKANKCESCGSLIEIEYKYDFNKKPFEEALSVEKDEFAESVKKIKCKSCGASVILNKFQAQNNCSYCGNSTLVESKPKGMLYVDSIIPFTFTRNEAFHKLKKEIAKRFYANKKIFKNIKEENINGAYVNAFIFDMLTTSEYSGVLSYTKEIEKSNGETENQTCYKTVNGKIDKAFKNITTEANSNLEQSELFQILPFEYASAVEFKEDFMQGYMLEYQDKMFEDCVKIAEKIIRSNLERDILNKYNCDDIVKLTLNTYYNDKKYNYCLLPVYFVNTVHKDKKYQVLINGQTGKFGRIPKDKWRVFFTVLLTCGLIVALIFLFIF